MLRFYRLVLVTIFIFAGVLFLAHLLGKAHPSAFAALFMTPDGASCESLCLYGIRPGTTTAQDAVSLLQTHPLTRHMRLAKFALFEQGPAHTTITLTPTLNGGLNYISLDSYSMPQPGEVFPSIVLPASGALGDIIALLGSPSFIFTSAGVWLYYVDEDSVLIVRTAPSDHTGKLDMTINPSDRIAGLTLYSRPHCQPTTSYQFHKQWLGFTNFRQYTNAPTISMLMVGAPALLPCRT